MSDPFIQLIMFDILLHVFTFPHLCNKWVKTQAKLEPAQTESNQESDDTWMSGILECAAYKEVHTWDSQQDDLHVRIFELIAIVIMLTTGYILYLFIEGGCDQLWGKAQLWQAMYHESKHEDNQLSLCYNITKLPAL